MTYLSDIEPCVIFKRPSESNGDVKGHLSPKYHKRTRGDEHALTESTVGVIKKQQKKITEMHSRVGEGSAWLHFRLRSTELKGGPCTNETQFHATLSLPVLFPGFHFH